MAGPSGPVHECVCVHACVWLCVCVRACLHAPMHQQLLPMLQMWFLFCVIWGIGGTLDEDGRKKFDSFMRDKDARFPR